MTPPFVLTEQEFLAMSTDDDATVQMIALLRSIASHFQGQGSAVRLAGVSEAAEILGVHKPYVVQLREAGRLPKPLDVVAAGPIWLRRDLLPMGRDMARDRKRRQAGRVA